MEQDTLPLQDKCEEERRYNHAGIENYRGPLRRQSDTMRGFLSGLTKEQLELALEYRDTDY